MPPDSPKPVRGALSNPTGRFEAFTRHAFDDGWDNEPAPAPLPTQVRREMSRSIITQNQSPDVPFSRSINPYRGCEHGCIYCFARPSHSYLGLSAGLDFETRLVAKENAAETLRHEFDKRSYVPEVIALGTNTDPYQPIERQQRITRGLLEVFAAYNHPVSIITKSNAVLRDLDILAPMAERGLVSVLLSVTTLDRTLSRAMEPRAPTPARRLEAIAALHQAGIPTGVLAAPMIPALNDNEMERILQAAAEAGARMAGYVFLRLPYEIKDLFTHWLQEHYPDRAAHVLNLVRDGRGGRLYDATFTTRMRGTGPVADLLSRRFALATRRLGLNERRQVLRTDMFAVPPRAGDQLALF